MNRRKAIEAGLLSASATFVSASPLLAREDAKQAAHATTGDKYVEAQEHMRKARELLRDYLATNPSGLHGYIAARQLKALGSLTPRDDAAVPLQLQEDVNWRILLVQSHEGFTEVTLEITNQSPTRNETFPGFNSAALVIVANNHLYNMLPQGSSLPSGMTQGDYGNWVLQGGVTANIIVKFEPFDEDVTQGILRYARGGPGLTFNRLNIKQIPPI